MSKGKVWLVGAGPGDIGLLTRKGQQVLQQADTIVYDALVSLELLAELPQNAEYINVGKRSKNHLVPQEETNVILLEKAKEGKKVVRLKGGDPFVFGRGGEELELLAKEGIPFEIVPGITSAVAVPAYNGIPVTHRDYTSSFHVITGHKKKDGALDIDFPALVSLNATLVFLMGVSEMETICGKLMEAGMDKDTPAAILERGTTCGQKRAVATVSTLKQASEEKGIKSPAVIVVGKVCQLEQEFAWYEKKPLYGRQIMITRPRGKESVLAAKLRDLGAQAIAFPTIETEPIEGFLPAWNEMVKETRSVCVGFTSPRGVEYFFAQMAEQKKDMRELLSLPGISFAVLGKGTAAALEKYNIHPDFMPAKYAAAELGKTLVSEWDKDGVVYLYRAKVASQELINILEENNMAYRDAAIYETRYQTDSPITEKIILALESGEIDTVMFTSASTVEGFVQSFPDLDFTIVHAVCIGEQTAAKAREYGMQIQISKEATMDSMIECVIGDGSV